jgi:hypothetical protein
VGKRTEPTQKEEENARDAILKFGVPLSQDLIDALTEIGFPFKCTVVTLVPAILWMYVHDYRINNRKYPLGYIRDKEALKKIRQLVALTN